MGWNGVKGPQTNKRFQSIQSGFELIDLDFQVIDLFLGLGLLGMKFIDQLHQKFKSLLLL